jgi:hypothetical protein
MIKLNKQTKKIGQAGTQWLMPVILATQEDLEDHGSKPTWANSLQDLSRKYPTPNRAGRVAQVVECLPSKCEASGPPKRKEEEEEKGKKFPFWLLTRPHLSP